MINYVVFSLFSSCGQRQTANELREQCQYMNGVESSSVRRARNGVSKISWRVSDKKVNCRAFVLRSAVLPFTLPLGFLISSSMATLFSVFNQKFNRFNRSGNHVCALWAQNHLFSVGLNGVRVIDGESKHILSLHHFASVASSSTTQFQRERNDNAKHEECTKQLTTGFDSSLCGWGTMCARDLDDKCWTINNNLQANYNWKMFSHWHWREIVREFGRRSESVLQSFKSTCVCVLRRCVLCRISRPQHATEAIFPPFK